MLTLNQIISDLDNRLLQEEALLDTSALPTTVLGEIEEMRKYVLITIGKEHLAIPIDGLAEIGPMPPVTPLPNLPAWVLGIANQRGEIISVIDLDHLLRDSGGKATKGKKLAVLRSGTMKVGISIDQVVATVSRPQSDRVPLSDSSYASAEPNVFTKGLQVERTVYQILQPDSFMQTERLMRYYLSE